MLLDLTPHNIKVGSSRIHLPEGKSKIYFCGNTLNGIPHLGHLRVYIYYRQLGRALGDRVEIISNFTDSINLDREEIDRYYNITLNILHRYNLYPDRIYLSSQIRETGIQTVRQLISRKVATIEEGGIIHHIPHHPYLWKGDINSPDSAPGWHLQCYQMIMDYVGRPVWIHGGGADLGIHHENEDAISRDMGGPLAEHWVRVGLVKTGVDKLSKSNKSIVSWDLETLNPNYVEYLFGNRSPYKEMTIDEETIRKTESEWLRYLEVLERSLNREPIGDPRIWVVAHNFRNGFSQREIFRETLAAAQVAGDTPEWREYLTGFLRIFRICGVNSGFPTLENLVTSDPHRITR